MIITIARIDINSTRDPLSDYKKIAAIARDSTEIARINNNILLVEFFI